VVSATIAAADTKDPKAGIKVSGGIKPQGKGTVTPWDYDLTCKPSPALPIATGQVWKGNYLCPGTGLSRSVEMTITTISAGPVVTAKVIMSEEGKKTAAWTSTGIYQSDRHMLLQPTEKVYSFGMDGYVSPDGRTFNGNGADRLGNTMNCAKFSLQRQ
jgi:hypothetical protein